SATPVPAVESAATPPSPAPIATAAGPTTPKEKKKALCRFFNTKRGCGKGDACTFAHTSSTTTTLPRTFSEDAPPLHRRISWADDVADHDAKPHHPPSPPPTLEPSTTTTINTASTGPKKTLPDYLRNLRIPRTLKDALDTHGVQQQDLKNLTNADLKLIGFTNQALRRAFMTSVKKTQKKKQDGEGAEKENEQESGAEKVAKGPPHLINSVSEFLINKGLSRSTAQQIEKKYSASDLVMVEDATLTQAVDEGGLGMSK
ncbi:hypothetical protein HDV05_002734, partial [Chytridiales sp. JEL 0842]